jgi:alkylhydroperoxidase family enzyme
MIRTLRHTSLAIPGLLILLAATPARADDPPASRGAPPVPATRAQMLKALEDSKHATPRLPLPPVTEDEKARASRPESTKGLGGIVNNGRMRKHYLPAGVTGGGFTREPDPVMSLGNPFQTQLFWIVSRGNNCTYCMGHQEVKLASAGLTDDQIAALDGDWSEFDPKARAAYAFTRKLTFNPHEINVADIQGLRDAGYTDAQALEIVLVVGNFNAMNRWTGALRIPQEDHRDYTQPVSAKYRDRVSRVAPLADESGTAPAAPSRRPALGSPADADALLDAARDRAPRLELASEADARAVLGDQAPDGPIPNWMRLLARFPKAGPQRVAMHRAAWNEGELEPRFKAIIAYVAARHDRAAYALDQARRQLTALGYDEAQIAALDDLSRPLSADARAMLAKPIADPARVNAALPAERVVASFARKLTVDPALIDDADIEALRLYFRDRSVAEIVFHVTEAAFFDRLTEAAGLPLDP